MEINYFLLLFFSYLIGSIPFAYILTSIFGYGDIRKIGSGNVGATNVLRTGRKSLALIVLVMDVLKGFIPITFLFFYYKTQYLDLHILVIGSFAILGHIYPVWLKFRGGKGVSTYIGFILGIDYKLGITFIIIWIIIAFLKKYSSLASILCLIATPLFFLISSHDFKISYILAAISFIIIIKHTSNIKRLVNGLENKINF